MSLKKIRACAFREQHGICFYCGRPMIVSNDEIPAFAKQHDLSKREACQLLATAEHLLARSDGGGNSSDNIVAAHRVCNVRRHRSKKPKPPEVYQAFVLSRCNKGKWHSAKVLRIQPEP